MQIELLETMHTLVQKDLPSWEKLNDKMARRIPPKSLDLMQAHDSTIKKIAFADYHYYILNQLYRPRETEREKSTDLWALAEMHSIIMNLYSALDSLANEINLVHNFGIKEYNTHISHDVQKHLIKPNDQCLRCKLNNQPDYELTKFLNNELSQAWFETFRELRNRIVHKILPIINVTLDESVHIMIPNDPNNTNPNHNDYSKGLEINTYCQECRVNIIPIIERMYKITESLF